MVVRSVEGRPIRGELQVKSMIKGEDLALLEINLPAGAAAPLHVHSHEVLIYVVSGKVETTIGKQVFVLGPGDVCRHPRAVPHSVVALLDSRMIEIKAPAPHLDQVLGTRASLGGLNRLGTSEKRSEQS